ncbi:acylneuraminate cytidylyltransferase family protein [Ilumatobacter coccineus]|uniref:Putative CMP-sialic acid synthetase n=1 Tax=Ilumatobacter coccineus (strain NBRC 103263 / KCTC 29153 / YM16-304) TaxID=1313172 RepID=A0A6C7EH96_ILUCY|nr:acylneuraminate cytidylyltransferase family protein [Ilumatobacter coccineus]BAN03346.1 putative CMP-sialic acid synthetase [Ilumatobacter coccineus YM16-304]
MTAARCHPLVALVPLRAGSKGLPGKNTALLAGRPLYEHTLHTALDAGIGTVVVTTDIDSVLGAPVSPSVELIERPADLCGDDTPMDAVVRHAIVQIGRPCTVVLLQATSPLRAASDICAAVDQYRASDVDLVMSVCEADRSVRKWGEVVDGRFVPISTARECFTNRQQLEPIHRPNGAIYVFDGDWFLENGGFVTASIGAYVMCEPSSVDIDSAADLAAVERLLAERKST